MVSRNKMTLNEALREIEILKLQNKKLGEAFDSLDNRCNSLKLQLKLAQLFHNEKCAEFDKLCYDYYKLKAENEQFEQNMKNVLEIEKKNAVKEFAEKLKAKYDGCYIVDKNRNWLDFGDIDELFEEVFGNDEE